MRILDEPPSGFDPLMEQAFQQCVRDRRQEGIRREVDSRFTIDPNHLDAVIGRLHTAGIHAFTVTPPSHDALFLRNYEPPPAP